MSRNIKIIPKRFNSNKIKLFLDFTIIECFIIIALCFPLPFLFNLIFPRLVAKVFFSLISILGIISLFLEFKGQKFWKLIIYFVTFKFSKKVFFENYVIIDEESNNNDPDLISLDKKINLSTNIYEKLDGDFLITKTGLYMTGLEINGINYNLLSDDKQEQLLEQLANVFRQIDLEYSIISLPSILDFKNNINYLKRKQKSIKNNPLKVKQIDDYIEQLKNFGSTEIKKFYLTFYSKNKEELSKTIKYIEQRFNSIGFSPKFLNRYKLVNLIKNILNPYQIKDYTEEQIDKLENNIGLLLTYPKIKFEPNCMVVSNSNEEKFYLSFQIMSKYKHIPEDCWLDLFNGNDDTMIINVSPLDISKAESDIARALNKNKANQTILSQKRVITDRKIDGNLEIYDELINQIASEEEKLRSIDVNFISYGLSKNEILKNQKKCQTRAKETGFYVNELYYQQQNGYKNAILNGKRTLMVDFGQEIPCSTLASSFPFVSSNLNDLKGIPLGWTTETFEPLVLDQFKHYTQDKQRKSYSGLVLGTTGSGKSTLLNKILLFSIALDKKLIIFDVESEYEQLTKLFDGKWMDLSNGYANRINPLQPFGSWVKEAEDENDNSDNNDEFIYESKDLILQNHKDFFENWIAILYPELTKEERLIIANELIDLYLESEFYNKPVQEWKNTDFPTFDDLYKKLEKLDENEITKRTKFKILLFMKEFIGFGSYASLWNGHTTIDLSNKLITLDCNKLYDKNNKTLINAQSVLATTYIKKYIDVNWVDLEKPIRKLNKKIKELTEENERNPKIKELKKKIIELNDKKQTVIVFDEGHKFINPANPVALDFISDLVKRGRKRSISTLISTQNPTDFWTSEEVKNKTEGILRNMQYLFVGKLDSKDIETIDEMFKEYGGLTPEEKKFLKLADTFQYLFAIAKIQKFSFELNLTELEKENIHFTTNQHADESELFDDEDDD